MIEVLTIALAVITVAIIGRTLYDLGRGAGISEGASAARQGVDQVIKDVADNAFRAGWRSCEISTAQQDLVDPDAAEKRLHVEMQRHRARNGMQ